MSKHQQLAARIGAFAAMAMLVGASAFADSRPSNETRWRGDRDDRGRQERPSDRGESRHGDGSWRSDREHGFSHHDRQPYYAHGRVSRVSPFGSGYRVWVGGAPYPFFVPHAHFRADRFRIGVVIDIGGYYNPGGYYDYYGDGDYDGRYSRPVLRGVVERVNYRGDTFVMRDEASGRFVTVQSRDRWDDVRRGDYVEVAGDWARRGLFRAYDVDVLGGRYYGR